MQGGYIWPLIKASDEVCASPASKAQADADNEAASYRQSTATYGLNTCVRGDEQPGGSRVIPVLVEEVPK